MFKKILGFALLTCISGSALASTDIVMNVSSADKKFCFHEDKAHSPGSQIKPVKKVLTCREAGTSSNSSSVATWK